MLLFFSFAFNCNCVVLQVIIFIPIYLFPCSLFNSPPYFDPLPTSSIISGILLANIAYKMTIKDDCFFFLNFLMHSFYGWRKMIRIYFTARRYVHFHGAFVDVIHDSSRAWPIYYIWWLFYIFFSSFFFFIQ